MKLIEVGGLRVRVVYIDETTDACARFEGLKGGDLLAELFGQTR